MTLYGYTVNAVTPAMRRYAAEIYRLQEDSEFVSLSDLVAHIEASPQAVSRMLNRLKQAGYLTHEPYRGTRLTEAGERIAMPALRRHRLVEVFLVRVMGYGWDEAHELSDQFEKGVNGLLEDRIDELTGHPTRCPHGEPIPSKDGIMPELDDFSLVALVPGTSARISRVRTHDPDKLKYIGELGLVPGVQIRYEHAAPFDGPVRIRLGAQAHVLGRELAAALYVQPEPPSDR